MASSSARVIAVFLVGRSPRLAAARRARLSRVRMLGSSHGLARRLSLCAVDSTATRWTTVDSFSGPTLALRPAATSALSTAGGSSLTRPVLFLRWMWSTKNWITTASLAGKASSMP